MQPTLAAIPDTQILHTLHVTITNQYKKTIYNEFLASTLSLTNYLPPPPIVSLFVINICVIIVIIIIIITTNIIIIIIIIFTLLFLLF